MLYTMGGALAVDGNAPNGTAEWNYFVDPQAVATVLDSGVRTTIVPLDATDNVPVTRAFFDRLTAVALVHAGRERCARAHGRIALVRIRLLLLGRVHCCTRGREPDDDHRTRRSQSRLRAFTRAGYRVTPMALEFGLRSGQRQRFERKFLESTDRRAGGSRRARSPGRRLLHRDADCDADVLRVIRHVVRVAPCGRAGAGVHCRSRSSDRRGHRSPHPRVLHIVLDECCRLRVGIPRRDRDGSRARRHA